MAALSRASESFCSAEAMYGVWKAPDTVSILADLPLIALTYEIGLAHSIDLRVRISS